MHISSTYTRPNILPGIYSYFKELSSLFSGSIKEIAKILGIHNQLNGHEGVWFKHLPMFADKRI